MVVKVSKPEINVREKISELDKPSGLAGQAMLRAETPLEQFNLIGAGRRNLIINGSMAISQRSTSVSSQTATGYKTVDRIRVNGSGGTYNQSQQTVTVGGETGLPVQFTKFLRHECTAGNDNHLLMTRIEDVSKFVGTMKLSFYAKGSGADVLAVKFNQGFGSGGSTEIYTSAQSFTVTSTWQRFEFDIVMPSITGKTVGVGNFGSVLFGQDSSTSTAAWTLDITGLQWEHGNIATPFEHRSYGEELAACQRYYYQNTNPSFYACQYVSSHKFVQWPHPGYMRASPSATVTYSSGSFTAYQIDNKHFKAYISSSYTDTSGYHVTSYKLDAEL